MDRQQVEEVVLSVMAALLKCPVSKESQRKNTPQWDSLKHIEVIFAIEDELGLEFSEDRLSTLDSVERIVESAMDILHAA